MRVYAGTDIGKLRDTNEDFYYISSSFNEDIKICILADGMGGYEGGKIASNLAVEKAKNYIFRNYKEMTKDTTGFINLIKNATQYANMVVYEKALSQKELKNMGTTLEIVLFFDKNIYISHIGDSRIYKIQKNTIKKLTEDHIALDETNNTFKGLTKAIGVMPYAEPDLLVETFDKNDIFVICSDGLTNMLKDEDIKTIILNSKEEPNLDLIKAANLAGGRDNITVIVITDEE